LKSFKQFVNRHLEKVGEKLNKLAEPDPEKNFTAKPGESYRDQVRRKKNGSGVVGKFRQWVHDNPHMWEERSDG
jgi:hypothetical protein